MTQVAPKGQTIPQIPHTVLVSRYKQINKRQNLRSVLYGTNILLRFHGKVFIRRTRRHTFRRLVSEFRAFLTRSSATAIECNRRKPKWSHFDWDTSAFYVPVHHRIIFVERVRVWESSSRKRRRLRHILGKRY